MITGMLTRTLRRQLLGLGPNGPFAGVGGRGGGGSCGSTPRPACSTTHSRHGQFAHKQQQLAAAAQPQAQFVASQGGSPGGSPRYYLTKGGLLSP